MRMRKKKHTEERFQLCDTFLIHDGASHQGRVRTLFSVPDAKSLPLELEIGCGKGAFLLELAKQNPKTLYVAIEACREALLLAVEKVAEAGLSNVLFLSGDAKELAEIFSPGEVDKIYLNFSDPWPKSRHAKRRLTAPSFLSVYRNILKEGGAIRQKTDHALLFESSLENYRAAGWTLEDLTRDLHHSPWAQGNILTEYETAKSAQGLPIFAVTARRP